MSRLTIQYDPLLIQGDDEVVARADKSNKPLASVDISMFTVDADELAKLHAIADRRTDELSALRYSAVKERFISLYNM